MFRNRFLFICYRYARRSHLRRGHTIMLRSLFTSEQKLSENVQLLFQLPDVGCFLSTLSSGVFVCLSAVCISQSQVHLPSCSPCPEHKQRENQRNSSSLDEIQVMTHTSEPGLDKPPALCDSVITIHSQSRKVAWHWSSLWTSDPGEGLGNEFLNIHSCMLRLHLRGFRTHGGSWRAALSVRGLGEKRRCYIAIAHHPVLVGGPVKVVAC